MAGTLVHRGPDDAGVWTDASAGIALAHRRLSIIDLSASGHQPMHSACGRYVISFNGEIYNFKELRSELEHAGHAFHGHSDTEVLLAAVSQWGVAGATPRLNGMFAIALWDRLDQALYLIRDRFGEKPLYYSWNGNTVTFASELKALHAGSSSLRRDIDRQALAQFLRLGYIPAPQSIYEGVYKLPPACMLVVHGVRARKVETFSPAPVLRASADRVSPVYYWSPIEAATSALFGNRGEGASGSIEELERLLRDAVRLRMASDVPLGAFLSGGIDSSLVVALMQSQSSETVKTFAVGFPAAGYDETEHAAAVAQHLGTQHTALHVTSNDALSLVPALPEIYDEPFADASQIPTVLISRLARQQVTVALSGDGGDELFGGYNRYQWCPAVWNATRHLPRPVRHATASLLQRVPRVFWDTMFAALARLLPRQFTVQAAAAKVQKFAWAAGADDDHELYQRVITQWREPEDVVMGISAITSSATSPMWSALPGYVNRMMLMDAITYLPDDILVKVDRASMSSSLEVRAPYLDHRVYEHAWRLPAELKVSGSGSKQALRRILYRHVPSRFFERPKSGFAVPLHEWLRGPLRDWAESLLSESRLRKDGFFRPECVRKVWLEHVNGKRDWQQPIWTILMFQAWWQARA